MSVCSKWSEKLQFREAFYIGSLVPILLVTKKNQKIVISREELNGTPCMCCFFSEYYVKL